MKNLAVAGLVLLFVASSGAMAYVVTLDADRDSELCNTDSNKGLGGKYYCPANVLMSWDLSGVTLGPGEYVASGKLTLFNSTGGPSNYNYDVVAYPLVKTWGEGIGIPVDGYGGEGWPWGPVSVGDSTYTYQIVSQVVADPNYQFVASAGTPWAGLGATGAADSDQTRPLVQSNLAGGPVSGAGASLGSLPLTAAGCGVVEDWINLGLANNGVVMIFTDLGGSVLHLGTRETAGAPPGPGVAAAELELTIVPEPASMLLLLGGIAAVVRRRKR